MFYPCPVRGLMLVSCQSDGGGAADFSWGFVAERVGFEPALKPPAIPDVCTLLTAQNVEHDVEHALRA